MKINWKSFGFSIVLLMVLGGVIIVELSLFISGPARKYEHDIEQQITKIETNYKDIKQIQRHVFYYTTYSGQDENRIVWFNEVGKAIVSRKLNTLNESGAKKKAEEDYGIVNAKISLGYGYDNPVYIALGDNGTILLDYDSLKEVFLLKEGDV